MKSSSYRPNDLESDVHLMAIRKALANRNAAVMVGAGFSRNAEGGQHLATWRQLSEALAAELSPNQKILGFSPSSTAQLAEQYSRVFSPTHLEDLIKKAVPDDQVAPASLHTSLLRLPWAEVFTTNYDTLLERAAEKLFDVQYFTILSREDIPQSNLLSRRRIVKLHGSFPSHRPFILTEEDYRTYPERFAPFVNLVRQSLLENVFCLIGFSGDDPNFLHWLGWVRDMLDKHALPVYLFLSSNPTLGERKLYEARGVVPVVLPLGESGDHSDYKARYARLFEELKRPLTDSPLNWGNSISLREFRNGDNPLSDTDWFLDQLPAIANARNSYPGWLIAPDAVRNNFRHVSDFLESHLNTNWLQTEISKLPIERLIVVLELYCWVQQIMLGPIDDKLAFLAYNSLDKPSDLNASTTSKELLSWLDRMDINGAARWQSVHKQLALALLTWARQSHRVAEYKKIQTILGSASIDDSQVYDRLRYEEVLRRLHNGDRVSALDEILRWRPRSSDPYVHVLKASLMAEAGEAATAISLCEGAIQVMRRQQRSRPEDASLISKEAWACLIAALIQRVVDFMELHSPTSALRSATSLSSESNEKEDFSKRVDALGAMGYSARDELRIAASNLNAEAEPPTPLRQRTFNFDLGSISNNKRFGAPSDLREKILASFAWLDLIERVGLMPGMKQATTYAQELLQAAWWIRFADRPERSLGLLLRSGQKDALKPRDMALPPHRTGWLDRYEVALIREDVACDISAELIVLITSEFSVQPEAVFNTSRIEFFSEVFSRIALIVRDEGLVLDWSRRLINLHRSLTFQTQPTSWKIVFSAIVRIFENLSRDFQLELLLSVYQLPVIPPVSVTTHYLDDWVNVTALSRSISYDNKAFHQDEKWRGVIEDLLSKFSNSGKSDIGRLTLRRLETLRILGLLTVENNKQVGEILWRDVEQGEWPTIPGFSSSLPLVWPAKNPDIASQHLEYLLKRPLRPFSSGYMQIFPPRNKRSYSIGGAQTILSPLMHTLNHVTLNYDQRLKIVEFFNEWLGFEQEDILLDAVDFTEIEDTVRYVVDQIDQILSTYLLITNKRKSRQSAQLQQKIMQLDEKLGTFRIERPALQLSFAEIDDVADRFLMEQTSKLIVAIGSDQENISNSISRATIVALSQKRASSPPHIQALFDSVISCLYAQKMPSLLRALNILENLPQDTYARLLDNKSLLFIDLSLESLHEHLKYGSHIRPPSINQEHVPLLRFKVIRLSYLLSKNTKAKIKSALMWLNSAADDPLPEIRLGRYKY